MSNDKIKIVCIILLAIVIRIIAALVLGSPEVWEYEEIANNILAGKGFQYTFLGSQNFAPTEPLYPYLTSFIYLISGHNQLAMVIMQVLFSVLLILIVYFIGKTVFDGTVGIIASFIMAIHPAFIYYDVHNLHPLSLGAMFLALSIFLIILTKKQLSIKIAALTGFVSGVGMLARGTVGSFFPIGLLWLFIQLRKNKKVAGFLFVMGICFIVPIASWTIRNFILLGKFIPIRSTAYVAFWYGYNENASGSSLTKDGLGMLIPVSSEMRNKIYGATEVEQNKIFREEAIKFIKNNPRRFWELTLRKAFYFWWFSPQSGALYSKRYTKIYKIFHLLFLVLFLAGVYFSFKTRNNELNSSVYLFLLLFLSVASMHALTYVDFRHRLGIEPLMALFAGFAISKIKDTLFPKLS